jgi:D-alanyl-D-alanine carboxypeptidase
MRSGRLALAAALIALLGAACAPAGSETTTAAHPQARLTRAIDADLVAHPKIPGEAVSVRGTGLDVEAARGYADVKMKTPLKVDTPFRVASVTKTFVAAAVLRLVEQHQVALDQPIARYLSPNTTALLTRGGYEPGTITVRELLNHTSGLYDYAASRAYDTLNTTDPGRHWTPREQLQFAMDHGHPLAAPGRRYHYADTNYVLLGEILERATGHSLAQAVRDEVGFAKLGLDETYWESFEPAPAGQAPRAHQYYDRTFDNITLDASADLYGGGGLVSTVGDLTRFFRGLFDGQVFTDPSTLHEMLTITKPARHAGAGLGIFATKIAGEQCWGHPGYWGTEAYACPKEKMAFALETNQANEDDLDTTAVERTIMSIARRAQDR